jgi:hypothetical protein
VVERVYGVFKSRFQNFHAARDGFSLRTQTKMIYALSAVHNWINSHRGRPKTEWRKLRNSKPGSKARKLYEEMLIERTVAQQNSAPLEARDRQIGTGEAACSMHMKRDKMAQEMWENYQLVLAERGSRDRGPPEWESSNSELSDSSGLQDEDEGEETDGYDW